MDAPEIYLCGRKITDVLADFLSAYNSASQSVTLSALGENANALLRLMTFLQENMDLRVPETTLSWHEVPPGARIPVLRVGVPFPRHEVLHKSAFQLPAREDEEGRWLTLSYIQYHLLLEHLLRKHRELRLRPEGASLVRFTRDRDAVTVEFRERHPDRRAEICAALERAGLFLPRNATAIIQTLGQYDDVLVCLDTNVLIFCTITEYFLPLRSLLRAQGILHLPNWILFVLPITVMHELEIGANSRDERGFLTRNGRKAYRALQEILELTHITEIPGISVLTVGDADPSLDMRSVADQIVQMTTGARPKKSSAGDHLIRHQFRSFLRQIQFRKGAFFLTADKSNAALANAEGLHAIYVENGRPSPSQEHIVHAAAPVIPETDFYLRVPAGKVLYELAVSFGGVELTH